MVTTSPRGWRRGLRSSPAAVGRGGAPKAWESLGGSSIGAGLDSPVRGRQSGHPAEDTRLPDGANSRGPGGAGGQRPRRARSPGWLPGPRGRRAPGRERAVLRAAGGAVRGLGPGRELSSCLKGRRGTWLGRSSRPRGRGSEAGRLRSASASAAARAPAGPDNCRSEAAEGGTPAAMAEAAPDRVSAPLGRPRPRPRPRRFRAE